MAGLLDILNRNPGLLSPMPAGSALGPGVDQAKALLAQPMPVAAPAERQRVNPARIASRFIFGGEDPFTAYDGERNRLRAEAMAPQLRAQQAQTLASITDPTERALFLQAPDVWAENAGYRLRPRTLAPGSVERVNGQTVGGAPIVEKFDDRFGAIDPLNVGAGATYTAPRGLTASEETANNKLAWDREYGNRNLGISEQNADTNRMNAETTAAAAGATLSPGQVRYDINGNRVAAVAPSPASANNPATIELQGRVDSTRRDVLPTTQRMRSLLTSGDVITGFGAGPRLDAARALAATGNEEAKRKVAATQEYQNLSGALRVGIAKSLGANPSNADILLLEKITAGDIGQSPEALLSTIGQAEERANSLVADVERQLAASRPNSGGGQIAVNPTTGARVQWNGSAWVPM